MTLIRSRYTLLAVRVLGAAALVFVGLDHYYEYSVQDYSVLPTIGTLFLLNFIAATVVGIGLLLPLGLITKRFAGPIRALLAIAGIGIAASSLVALWISETWSLFGFTDYGFRPAIVTAIVAEAVAVVALSAYLALAPAVRIRERPGRRSGVRTAPPGRQTPA
jgi:hypothetical protein